MAAFEEVMASEMAADAMRADVVRPGTLVMPVEGRLHRLTPFARRPLRAALACIEAGGVN